jgi:phosphoribosylformylglycinamidine synthase
MEIDLDKVPCQGECSALETWFSESNSRFVVTVAPEKQAEFEAAMAGSVFAAVGAVTNGKSLKVTGKGAGCEIELAALSKSYKTTLDRV